MTPKVASRRYVGATVLVALLAAGLIVQRLTAPDASTAVAGGGSAAETGAVVTLLPVPSWSASPGVVSRALRPCPAGAPDARAQLPAVNLACLGAGPALALNRLPSQPYLINLWASWCAPCQREAPRLAAAAAAARGRVGFLGVDTEDKRDSALAFLHRFGIDYPQLADPDADVAHRLPAPGLPVTLAVDAEGRVVYRRIGEITAAQLAAAVHAADPTLRLDPSRLGGDR